MTPTDTSEAGLEALIRRALTGGGCVSRSAGVPPVVAETPAPYGGVGRLPMEPADYDREYCVDLTQLAAFLRSTPRPPTNPAADIRTPCISPTTQPPPPTAAETVRSPGDFSNDTGEPLHPAYSGNYRCTSPFQNGGKRRISTCGGTPWNPASTRKNASTLQSRSRSVC